RHDLPRGVAAAVVLAVDREEQGAAHREGRPGRDRVGAARREAGPEPRRAQREEGGDVETGRDRADREMDEEAQRPGRVARVVAEDAVERAPAVAGPDLLALGVAAAVVPDARLVDPKPSARELRHDLRLEAEAVLLDLDGLDDLATEDLVAGL